MLLAVFLSSCSREAVDSELKLAAPAEFSDTGEVNLRASWWREFDNPKLDSLVNEALDSNLSLRATWHRFREARYVLKREKSNIMPDVEAFVTSGISRPEPDFVGGENLRTGLQASYEVDLWGRISSQIRAENSRLIASFRQYQTAALSLSAEVSLNWFRLVAAQKQLALATEQVENNRKILNLLKARFKSGQIRAVDILRQQQLLQDAQDQILAQEAQVAVLENQLDVLLGNFSRNSFAYTNPSLPAVPELPQTGLPAELIRRRPDVRQAFRNLEAADHELASAISARYPRFSINTNYASRSNDANNLFRTWAYSLSGNLVAPLFYGRELKAEMQRTEAVKKQFLYDYGQTVLNAYREVEDALIQEQKQKERLELLKERIQLASRTARQLRSQYLNGSVGYIDVLNALNQKQQLQRNLIAARLRTLEIRVGLYRALAGGINTDQPLPEPKNDADE